MAVAVDTFTKRTTVGTDTITLGFEPKALEAVYTGATAFGSFQDGYRFAWGVSDGTTHGCYASTSSDNVNPSNTGHIVSATKFLVVLDADQNIIAEATVSFNATGFVVDWTTNAAPALIIGFRAIGGADIELAKVVNVNQQLSPAGNRSITGVTFSPDLVGGILGGVTSPGVGGGTNLVYGWFDKDLNTFSVTVRGVDNANPSNTTRAHSTTRFLRDSNGSLSVTPISMDPDGFTINSNPGHATRAIVFLCLKIAGGRARVTSFAKSTGAAPVAQGVTGAGFQPASALFFGAHHTVDNTQANNARLLVGAADASRERAFVALDQHSVNPTNSHSYASNTKVLVVADNATPAIDAEADLTSFDTDGLTVTWTTNNAAGTRIGVVMIGESGVTTVSPNALSRTRSVPAPALTFGPITVSPSGLSRSRSVPQPTLTEGSVTITVEALTRTRSVRQPTLSFGAITVSPNGLTRTRTVRQPTVTIGAVTITPNALSRTRTVSAPTLSFGAITVSPNALSRTRSIGVPTLTTTGVQIRPDALAATRTVRQPTLTFQFISISPNGLTRTRTIPQPTVTAGGLKGILALADALAGELGVADTSAGSLGASDA